MRIEIKVSETMCGLKHSERRFARVPKRYRRALNIIAGEYLHLKTPSGKTLSLVIKPAFRVDAIDNEMCVYVTQETFGMLDIDDRNVANLEAVEGITLGCDPECVLMENSTGKTIKAYEKELGTKSTDVGHDGVLLEFRPIPSVSEDVVTDNLYNLIIKARHMINKSNRIHNANNVRISARSYYDKVSVGFHIHFGIPEELINRQIPVIFAVNQIVKALDYYLAIPCVILEGEDNIRRTAIHIPYGKPGEYRLEYPTLEYRVLGGHILKHPVITRGALALAATIVEDVVSRIKICTHNYTDYNGINNHNDLIRLYPNMPKDSNDIYKALCQKTPHLAFRYFDSILKDIEFMLTFKKHSENIKELINCILSKSQINDDIEQNWREYYHEQKQQGQMAVH